MITFIRCSNTQSLLLTILITMCAISVVAQDFSVYEGAYSLSDGRKITVNAMPGGVRLHLENGDLFQYSDYKMDERVLFIEEKTMDLISATILNDREKIKVLFGDSNGSMSDYIDNYYQLVGDLITGSSNNIEYETVTTVYRDEDSDYGFEDNGWGWETYVSISDGDQKNTIRIVWDGITGNHMHTGTGKEIPTTSSLVFMARSPSRSWIRALDPGSHTIKRIREVEREKRSSMIPARFVAYDINTHQTVGIRFRKEATSDAMKMHIGPLGSELLEIGVRSN